MTAAAARVGLSQAATSQALGELENLLERRLFDRHGRRLVLNEAGRRLLPSAVEVLDRVRGASAENPKVRFGDFHPVHPVGDPLFFHHAMSALTPDYTTQSAFYKPKWAQA